MPYRLRYYRREFGVHHLSPPPQRLELRSRPDCITHYRARLIRRRDLLRSFPYWGGLPAALGVALATLGWLLAEPNRWFDATTAGILGVGLQVALWASNNRTAAQLQKEIDLLDAA